MKRVVFVHPDGLHQILGAVPDGGQLPIELSYDGAVIETRGRIVPFASLYKVTTRAAFYKEPVVPGGQHFHSAQR